MQTENSKEKKYLIELIKSGTISNHWANAKAGQFRDFDNNCLYRFCETDENLYHYLQEEDEQRNLPVLACGFVAWLIKHWGNDTQTIYSGYLQAKLNQYKAEHKNDVDVFKRDLEREFYNQYRAKEEQYVKQSEAIFDFISEPEVNEIKNYVQYYFDYVDSLSNQLTINEDSKESKIMNNNNTDAIKQAREYIQYVSHNDIIELVKKINENQLDGDMIKKMLSDCLNSQFTKLPIQNDTLKAEVFNTFCFMVKNAETNVFTYGIISITTFTLDGKAHTTPPKPTIPKISTIARIFVDEWINEFKDLIHINTEDYFKLIKSDGEEIVMLKGNRPYYEKHNHGKIEKASQMEIVKYFPEERKTNNNLVTSKSTSETPLLTPKAYIDAKPQQPETECDTAYKIELNADTEKSVLENLKFWSDTKKEHKNDNGYKNIFEEITQLEFLTMVSDADFSTLNKKGFSQRVQYNVYILSRLLGNDWGNNAAQKLNKTLAECQKRTEFNEHKQLKTMYLQ